MPNYQLGKIYKIECNATGLIYVGSTCEPTLARRLAGHVNTYNHYLKGKFRNSTSFEIIKNNDYDIILLEAYPCNSKDELHARESYWTQNTVCVNKVKNQGIQADIGYKEYKKEYKKDWHLKNKEEHNLKSKKNYEDNKSKIAEYRSKIIDCDCGKSYTQSNKARHEKTNKHQSFINQ
jgi:hypothetical protein